MKVLMLNGSRRSRGCTYTALSLVEKELLSAGVETEILQVGHAVVSGSAGLEALVKRTVEMLDCVDGLVVGTPVYYASPSGEILMFLDRLFWEGSEKLRLKPAASVASARRAGTIASLDVVNKYFMINEMPVISSCYWNEVHGFSPEDVMRDAEGVQVMETLGRNFAWMLKCLDAAKKSGVQSPAAVERVHTNFIS